MSAQALRTSSGSGQQDQTRGGDKGVEIEEDSGTMDEDHWGAVATGFRSYIMS